MAFFGVLIPLFIVPPYPISDARILAGTITIPIIGVYILLNIITLVALSAGHTVGKFFQILFSVLMLFVFPIGTALHAWALYELYSDSEAREYLARSS